MFVRNISVFLSLAVLVTGSNVHLRARQSAVNSNNFYYPEQMSSVNKVSHNRTPIVDKARCNENEYLYPGDNPTDWTCDCKPGFMFYPVDGRCYEAYRKGPCKQGEILILQKIKNKKVTKCVLNECKSEGIVNFLNKCQPLDSTTPCLRYHSLTGRKIYLGVKPSTYELTCTDVDGIYECNRNCCIDRKGNQKCFRPKRKNTQKRI